MMVMPLCDTQVQLNLNEISVLPEYYVGDSEIITLPRLSGHSYLNLHCIC